MRFKISILAILILFSSLALQAATKLDACALFTKTGAEALLGEKTNDGKHGIMENDGSGGTAIVSQCIYRSAANFNKSADLVVRISPGGEKISASIPTIRKNLKEMASAEPQNISGIGDQAFWAPVGPGDYHSIQLNVFRDDHTYLIISVKGFPDQQAVEKAKTIALKLLSRLPS